MRTRQEEQEPEPDPKVVSTTKKKQKSVPVNSWVAKSRAQNRRSNSMIAGPRDKANKS